MRLAKTSISIVAAYAIASTIFGIDLLTPVGMGVWVFYLIPVVLVHQSRNIKTAFTLDGVCTALMIMDFIIASPTTVPLYVVVNRIIGIGLLWITAVVLVNRKSREEVL